MWHFTQELLQATYSLHNFRSRYTHYQDTPMALLSLGRLETIEHVKLFRKSIVFLFIAIASLRFLVLQRRPKLMVQKTPQKDSFSRSESERWANMFGGFAIVLCHHIWYDILGHRDTRVSECSGYSLLILGWDHSGYRAHWALAIRQEVRCGNNARWVGLEYMLLRVNEF